MKYIFHLVTKYPLSALLIAAIWYLCLCDVPETRLSHVRYIDKWTHTVMYLGTCTVIWAEYLRRHTRTDWKKVVVLAWLAPVAMSGVIELAQAYCTGGRRSGEWLDFAANTVGCTLALAIGTLLAAYLGRRRKARGATDGCRNDRRR